MSGSEDSTRPLSVAELLARNGTIGAPPVGGRRRRRRRNSDGVSVAELTGEIPIVRTGEIPVIAGYELENAAGYYAEEDVEDAAYEEVQYEEVQYEEVQYAEVQYAEVQYAEVQYEEVQYEDDGAGTYTYTSADTHSGTDDSSFTVEEAPVEAVVYEPEPAEDVIYAPVDVTTESADRTESQTPPRASDPLPRRSRGSGLELSHDPRPQRRSSGAEQMAYDPVDQSVDLSELVEQQGAEELRSFLQASSGTLFSGGTVADDLARRGFDTGSEPGADYDASAYDRSEYDQADRDAAPASAAGGPGGIVGGVWNGLVALLQSLLAVALGAGLFIGFDHLWHWNKLVALVLTVLVVLSLAAGVRVVRKTEDIVSTLTAVAVGLLVTLGPLALQST